MCTSDQYPQEYYKEMGRGLSLKELLALIGTWDERAGLSCERTNLTVEGRGSIEDIEQWEEQKPLGYC